MAGRPLRPATRHRLGGPLPHQLADRPRALPEAARCNRAFHPPTRGRTTCGISRPFERLSPTSGQVTHVLLTRLPLTGTRLAPRRLAGLLPLPADAGLCRAGPFDLHVLCTPPALILSWDHTLRTEGRRLLYAPALRLARQGWDLPTTLRLLRHRLDMPPPPPRPWLWQRDQGLSTDYRLSARRLSALAAPIVWGASGPVKAAGRLAGPCSLKSRSGRLKSGVVPPKPAPERRPRHSPCCSHGVRCFHREQMVP